MREVRFHEPDDECYDDEYMMEDDEALASDNEPDPVVEDDADEDPVEDEDLYDDRDCDDYCIPSDCEAEDDMESYPAELDMNETSLVQLYAQGVAGEPRRALRAKAELWHKEQQFRGPPSTIALDTMSDLSICVRERASSITPLAVPIRVKGLGGVVLFKDQGMVCLRAQNSDGSAEERTLMAIIAPKGHMPRGCDLLLGANDLRVLKVDLAYHLQQNDASLLRLAERAPEEARAASSSERRSRLTGRLNRRKGCHQVSIAEPSSSTAATTRSSARSRSSSEDSNSSRKIELAVQLNNQPEMNESNAESRERHEIIDAEINRRKEARDLKRARPGKEEAEGRPPRQRKTTRRTTDPWAWPQMENYDGDSQYHEIRFHEEDEGPEAYVGEKQLRRWVEANPDLQIKEDTPFQISDVKVNKKLTDDTQKQIQRILQQYSVVFSGSKQSLLRLLSQRRRCFTVLEFCTRRGFARHPCCTHAARAPAFHAHALWLSHSAHDCSRRLSLDVGESGQASRTGGPADRFQNGS